MLAKLCIQSHLTGPGFARVRVSARFVLTHLVFPPLRTVPDLLHRPLEAYCQAYQGTFCRFKKAEWTRRPFYRRFLAYLGRLLQWTRTRKDNCLILDATVLPKRGKTRENLDLVHDHPQGKTVPGYEALTLGQLPPGNFSPVDFDFRFSRTVPKGAGQAQPLKPRGETDRRLQEEPGVDQAGVGPEDVESCPEARDSGALPVGGRLVYLRQILSGRERLGPSGHRSPEAGSDPLLSGRRGDTLRQRYQGHRHQMVQVAELGLSLLWGPVRCGNGLKRAIVFTKGYKEPDPASRPGAVLDRLFHHQPQPDRGRGGAKR